MPSKQDIKEYSVFESIDTKRYHSCVITGYSYDFIYFDEIVFPILRKKGITNIILLIDSSMLENALKKISTSHFRHSQAYSISSIRKTGAFHPKIIQCFSEREGLLTIGSGNPTYGGYSANWEAWISFHVEHANDAKAGGFLKTWNYVKQLSSDIRGIVNQKLSWIEEYAPWLKEIKTADLLTMNPLTDGYSFAVLDNGRSGIYSEMTGFIPSEKAKVINIHSPFYDDDSSILRLLSQTYSPEKMNIFIQSELTVLNSKNLKNLNGTLDFYDINQCMSSFSKAAQRYAHAKLLEIRFQNHSYLLLGSANLSKSAFGTDSFSPRNAEISLLLHSQDGTHFFENMGLTPQKEAKYSLKQIESLVSSGSFISDTGSQDHHIYHIDSIDRNEKYYSVFLPASPQHQLNLKLYDFRGIEIATIKQNEQMSHGNYYEPTFLKIDALEDAVSGCLYGTKQLSNMVVVQDVFAQTRSYPNPTYRKLKTTLHSIENGEDHLWKLFNLIEPEKLIIEPSDLPKRHTDSSQDKRSEEPEDFKVISHEELQKKLQMSENQTKLFEIHFQRDNALQVLSILNTVMGRVITEEEIGTIGEEEEVDIDETNGRSEDNNADKKKKHSENVQNIENPESCRRHAERFFDKYHVSLKTIDAGDANISDIQILFALHAIVTDLLIFYSTSAFSTSQNINIGSLIPLINQNTDKDFFWYGIETVGTFYSGFLRKSLKSISAEKRSDFSQDLLNESARIAGLNSLFITCAVAALKLKSVIRDYSQNSVKMCLCEYFNIMEVAESYFTPYSRKEITDYFVNIIRKMRVGKKLKGKNIFKVFNGFWEAYTNKNRSTTRSSVSDLNEKRLYYHGVYGYTYLKSLSEGGISENTKIRLALPGISWDDEYEDFISEKIFQAKLIPIYNTQIELNTITNSLHSGGE